MMSFISATASLQDGPDVLEHVSRLVDLHAVQQELCHRSQCIVVMIDTPGLYVTLLLTATHKEES